MKLIFFCGPRKRYEWPVRPTVMKTLPTPDKHLHRREILTCHTVFWRYPIRLHRVHEYPY
jgi:hypothetical protein